MKRDFARLQQGEDFDLLVCGGGIYGAWTAYDAALRGLKVALVEQGDWASATSSASSKLIHGGLRYLESYDFKLVKKALAERRRLLDLAPHRVWPLRFGVPVYEGSRVGRFMLAAGLLVYDFLAGKLFGSMRHRHFSRKRFAEKFALLERRGMKTGFTYQDAQTDDARLVLELVDGAMQAGAVCVNYCKLNGLHEKAGQVDTVTLQDMAGAGMAEIRARQIVMTAGQWATTGDESAVWCRMSKGIHLVLPQLLQDEALLLTAPQDGRVFFMIPWYGCTLVGTTDSDYHGDISAVAVEDHEVQYLLDACNHYLRNPLHRRHVQGSFAGLRVMKHSGLASPSAVSRDWELKQAHNGVLFSIGGKITSAREDATVIVDAVCDKLGLETACATSSRKLPWAPAGTFEALLAQLKTGHQGDAMDAQAFLWLGRRHGRRAVDVLEGTSLKQNHEDFIVPGLPLLWADLLYCAGHEMVVHLPDLLRRRMPLLILAHLNEGLLLQIAQRVAPQLEWDEATISREVALCLNSFP